MTADEAFTLVDALAVGLAMFALGEIAASRVFDGKMHKLVIALLFWEGVAMLACATVIWVRGEIFELSTIVSVIAIWMAGAAIGLLRAGVFDAPGE